MGAATAAMLPFRAQVNVAAAALVLVLPVVGAMVVGGAWVGLLAVVIGFVVLDVAFIPPYGTLAVGSAQNWLALGVYVAVVLLVALVVSRLQKLRAVAARHDADSRRLLELSEVLVEDKPVPNLLGVVASSVRRAFELETVALLLPPGETGYLEIVASDGLALEGESLERIMPAPGTPASLTGSFVAGAYLWQIPLAAAGRPVGLLVLRGRTLDVHDRALLATYANHAALAIERAQLRDQALRADLLQKVDEWRAALVGTVAHDLRTPLASIKVAVSDLRDPAIVLGDAARHDLLETIEEQTDRLTRLVSTVLDLWSLEAGARRPKREPVVVDDLIDDAAALVESSLDASRLERRIPSDLPPIEVDPILMGQALGNLLENAARHSPPGAAVLVEASRRSGYTDEIEIAVSDSGPGVPPDQRDMVFDLFHRGAGGGRAGLGLAIAKAFVEAHGGRVASRRRPRRRRPLRADRARSGVARLRVRRRGKGAVLTSVLVVDDDPALLRALRIGLEARGFEVAVAHTGAEGLSRAAQAAPDLVVLDLGLPDLDGVEVCRRLRQWTEVPVIVLSALDSEDRKVLRGQRRGRLCDQALRDARARGAAARRPQARRGSEPLLGGVEPERRAYPARLRGPCRRGAGRRGGADGARVRPARLSRPQRRQGLHAPDDPPRGLGAGVRQRDPLSARLREPPAPKAGPTGRTAA